MGSKQFPEPNGLNNYVGAHGGNANAWTGTEFSNYFFEVDNDALPQAVTRLTDMLIQPNFEAGLINKEIRTIDAEFELKRNDDLRRLYQVHKETCNPEHPFSRFSVGNADIFNALPADVLRQALIDFHHRYYQPQNARLCMISSLPIQQQLERVECALSNWQNSSEIAVPVYPPLYLPEQLGVVINIRPIQEAKRLIITFALPSDLPQYQSKPLHYISHLIGDESVGSLLHYLKTNKWANTLSAGGGIQGSHFKDFNVNIQLTDTGLHHWQTIVEGLFAYLKLIEEHLDEPWRIKEKQVLSQLAFDYAERIKPFDEAAQLANQLFLYPTKHVISGEFLMPEASAEDVLNTLALFTPDNLRVKLISADIETDRNADWYHTPYKISSIPTDFLKALGNVTPIEQLSLPDANPYISEPQLQLFDHIQNESKIICRSNSATFWFAQDNQFKQPKGDIYLSFDCEAVQSGIEVVTLKRLWATLLNERLREAFYDAGIAGLNYHLYPHQGGYSLHTSGFSARQMPLCLDILHYLTDQRVSEEQFNQVKLHQLTGLKNKLLNKPINRLFNRLSVILQSNSYASADMANTLNNATLAQLNDVKQQLLQQTHLEALIHGNWSHQEGLEFAETLNREYNFSGRAVSRNIADIRGYAPYQHQVDCPHDDAAIVLYFQSPSVMLQDTAMMMLLEQLLASPFFHHMRTEKQVGYLVGSGYMPINQHPGMVFYAQSHHCSAAELSDIARDFLQLACEQFSPPESLLEGLKASLIKQLTEPDANLAMKSQRLWLAIGNKGVHVNRNYLLAEQIQQVDVISLLVFARKMLSRAQFGELLLYSPGKHQKALNYGQALTNISEFKQNARYIR